MKTLDILSEICIKKSKQAELDIQTEFKRQMKEKRIICSEFFIKKDTPAEEKFFILNYTMVSPRFDPVADECRSLVISADQDFKMVSRSFDRFYNTGEIEDKSLLEFGDGKYLVEKMDGHLINLFTIDGEWMVSTRGVVDGSNSPIGSAYTYSQIVRDILGNSINLLNSDFTYICELIHPNTRVVTNYNSDEYGLYLLAKRSRWEPENPYESTDKEKENSQLPFKYPKKYGYSEDTFETLLEQLEKDETVPEGYVLYTKEGKPLAKIKTQSYLELHKELWVSQGVVWDKVFKEEDVSDYYFYGSKLMVQVWESVKVSFETLQCYIDSVKGLEMTDKDFALNVVTKFEQKYHQYMFKYKKNPNRISLIHEFQKKLLTQKIDFCKVELQKLKDKLQELS